MLMFATKPLPQPSLRLYVTAHVLSVGVVVMNVAGADGADRKPLWSVARTLSVYEVPGTRFCAVNEVDVDSPSSSLFVPFCSYTSYLMTVPPVDAGHEIVAVCADTLFTVGWPGADSAALTGLFCDGVSWSVTIEYGGMTCVPLVPCCACVIEVASSP